MSTTIQISNETKDKLLTIMTKLQKKQNKRVSYEDAIEYLINQEENKIKERKEFSKRYFGSLERDKAIEDLKELRSFER